MNTVFHFFTRVYLTELTGIRAANLIHLLDGMKKVPGSSIYYHTHRFLQQHHFLSPEPPNDFAYWITNILQENILGEEIASIDIIQFKTIRELREKLICEIEKYILSEKQIKSAPEGQEFHFMKSRSFILPTNYTAANLEQFYDVMKKISIHSLYFHIFESRLRLEKGTNDFSLWLETSLNEKEIAERISRLDPYTQTLEGLRRSICCLIEERMHGKDK